MKLLHIRWGVLKGDVEREADEGGCGIWLAEALRSSKREMAVATRGKQQQQFIAFLPSPFILTSAFL